MFRSLKPLSIFFYVTLGFFYLPLIVLFVFSFNSSAFPSPWHSFTLRWYTELFQTSELWASLGNSCLIALSSTGLCLLMACTMLFFLSYSNRIKRSMFLFYGNLVFPETLLAVALISYFSLLCVPLGFVTIIIAHTVLGLGILIPACFVRFNSIHPHIREASIVCGATQWQTFYRITLPLMRPTLIALGLLLFFISFDDFILSFFCSGNQVQTLSLYLLSAVRYGISPVVNALASILFLVTGILACIFVSIKPKERIF